MGLTPPPPPYYDYPLPDEFVKFDLDLISKVIDVKLA